MSDLVPLVLDLMRKYPDALRPTPPGGNGIRRRAYRKGGGLSLTPHAVYGRRVMITTLRRAGASQRRTAQLLGVSVKMVERVESK